MILTRVPHRVIAGTIPAIALLLTAPVAGTAQLRPLRPLDWDVFAPGTTVLARVGGGVLDGQRASLAGTRGRLLELGDYTLAWRTGRVALGLAGTLVHRFHPESRFAEPASGAEPGDSPRSDAGDLAATTAVRLSPTAWPALVVLRFGARLPTADHVKGLDRGEADFLGLLAVGAVRGRFTGGIESGIGIFDTRIPEFTQDDDWIYAARFGYRLGRVRPQAAFTGQSSPLRYRHIRGNEDLREVRLCFRVGDRRWLEADWVRGLVRFSPSSGLLVSGGARFP